jgi:uncharacterized coiled-coil protein SlyX
MDDDHHDTPEPILIGRPPIDFRELEQRVKNLERKQRMTEATVAELTEAVTTLTSAFNTFATDVNQTIADIEAKEANGGTITAAELGPIKDSLTSLSTSVDAADATVKGDDPGPVAPTSETVTVPIGANGEGSVAVQFAASRLSITTGPTTGTATLEASTIEPDTTELLIVGATPETSATVVLAIAAE